VTTTTDREQVLAVLRHMVRRLNGALESGEWDLEVVRILNLAEEISDWHAAWKANQPRTWALPAEPGQEVIRVRDAVGRVHTRVRASSFWSDGDVHRHWEDLLCDHGPLADASADRKDDS
jgi:hypothetical protein